MKEFLFATLFICIWLVALIFTLMNTALWTYYNPSWYSVSALVVSIVLLIVPLIYMNINTPAHDPYNY